MRAMTLGAVTRRRTLPTSVAAAAALAAAAASAQSTISVYGIADAGLVIEGGGAKGRVTKLTSGIASGSRIGFKGVEDLGGGNDAHFLLESGFGLDNGANAQGVNANNPQLGLFFGRLALVGLKGGWGTLNAGRLYTPYAATIANLLDPFATGMAGTALNIFNSTGLRANNSVQYFTPNWNGFSADAMVSLGEVPNDTRLSRGTGGGMGYSAGRLNVRVAHWRREAAVPNVDAARNTLLAGTYDFGSAKLHLGYSINNGPGSAFYLGQAYVAPAVHNPYGTSPPPTPSTSSRDLLIGGTIRVGADTVLVSYIHRDDRTSFNQDADQYAIGYSHPLSKRTDIYAAYGRIRNHNGAGYTVGNNGDVTFGSGNHAVNLGVRHLF